MGNKSYFGCATIEKDEIEGSEIKHPVHLEYYMVEKSVISKFGPIKKEKIVYGVEIVKKDSFNKDIPYIEKHESEYIAKNIKEANELITILCNNKVTPTHMDEIICDLKR